MVLLFRRLLANDWLYTIQNSLSYVVLHVIGNIKGTGNHLLGCGSVGCGLFWKIYIVDIHLHMYRSILKPMEMSLILSICDKAGTNTNKSYLRPYDRTICIDASLMNAQRFLNLTQRSHCSSSRTASMFSCITIIFRLLRNSSWSERRPLCVFYTAIGWCIMPI